MDATCCCRSSLNHVASAFEALTVYARQKRSSLDNLINPRVDHRNGYDGNPHLYGSWDPPDQDYPRQSPWHKLQSFPNDATSNWGDVFHRRFLTPLFKPPADPQAFHNAAENSGKSYMAIPTLLSSGERLSASHTEGIGFDP